MKVVRADIGAGDVERSDRLRLYVDYSILVLQQPFDKQKAAACDDHAVALENIRRKDHIGDAGFILKREKDKPLCCAGALMCDHAASDADSLIAAALREFLSRQNAFLT